MSIPRSEHPRPQFIRADWLNLNGSWSFTFDFGKSGHERGFEKSAGFDREITVPFCPESKLSGIAHTDFIECMWYHRKISIPADWRGKNILLHFGAVDYDSVVFIDGKKVGRHIGGSASFRFDISRFVKTGSEHDLVVQVKDDTRSPRQAGGKQCGEYKSRGCSYTRTTGIWQTVWLEAVAPQGLGYVRIVPDIDGSRFIVTPEFHNIANGFKWRAMLKAGGQTVAECEAAAVQCSTLELPVKEPRLWSPEDPFLYDLTFEVIASDGNVIDNVESYAGLRKVHIEGDRFYLNNKPLYQRLVLDQGFYPDGIWTAPSDEALRHDIELSMRAGFNGARLHQKVFEERFHYWADKLGYLTWGESSSWGTGAAHDAVDIRGVQGGWDFINEWREVVRRDLNHPSIIAWTPLNETRYSRDWQQHARFHNELYDICKTVDPTRPVNDASGYVHVKTDLWTVHNYEQDGDKLKDVLAIDPATGVWRNFPEHEADYEGQPYLVDEFGGIKWIPPERQANADNSWGYGDAPKSIEEVYSRLEGQVKALLSHPHISGYCYTQLTDVEQEENGVYNYDRSEKFDMKRIHKIFSEEPEEYS